MPVAYGSYQGIFAAMFEGLLRKKGKYRSHLLGSPNRVFIPYFVVLLLVSSWVVCGVSCCSAGGLGHCVYVHLCPCSPIPPMPFIAGPVESILPLWQNASGHGTAVFV